MTVGLATFVLTSLILWMKAAQDPESELQLPFVDSLPADTVVVGTGSDIVLGPVTETNVQDMAPPPNAAAGATDDVDGVPVYLIADAWATVAIDGQEVGQLPQAAPFKLTPGQHTLLLTSPDIEPLTTEIVVTADKPARFNFHLAPRARMTQRPLHGK